MEVPDPHCGVLVNLDYVYCRTTELSTINNRKSALVLFWPRVFMNRESAAYKSVKNEIDELTNHRGRLYELFLDRYGSSDEANSKIKQMCFSRDGSKLQTESLIGVWSNGTKQSRIFRQYCDLIILGDSVITGNHITL